jgi:hypothetical protein
MTNNFMRLLVSDQQPHSAFAGRRPGKFVFESEKPLTVNEHLKAFICHIDCKSSLHFGVTCTN